MFVLLHAKGIKRELGSTANSKNNNATNKTSNVLDISEQDELLLDRQTMAATHDQMRLEKQTMADDVSSLDGSQSARDTVKKVFFNALLKHESNVDPDNFDLDDDKDDTRLKNGDGKKSNLLTGDADGNDKNDTSSRKRIEESKEDAKDRLEDEKLLKDFVPDDGGSGSGSGATGGVANRRIVVGEADKRSMGGGDEQEISGNSPLEDSVLHGPEAGITRVFIEPMIVKRRRRKKRDRIVPSQDISVPSGDAKSRRENISAKKSQLRRLLLLKKAVFSGE